MSGSSDYQVALSFAGEQRPYVEEVARSLQARGVSVFYDGFETAQLWGKNGAEAFDDAFARRAAYVVMFISRAYVTKAWPRHERRSAIGRMIHEDGEYVLPVRFDDTPVPGLPDDVIYLRAADHAPAELAVRIAEKVGMEPFEGKASEVPPPRMTSWVGEAVFDYGGYNGRYVIGTGEAEFETAWTKASDTSIHLYNDPPSINGVAVARGVTSIAQVRKASALDYTSRVRTVKLGGVAALRNRHGFYACLRVLEILDDSRADDCDELRFRYAVQRDGSDDFGEFAELDG